MDTDGFIVLQLQKKRVQYLGEGVDDAVVEVDGMEVTVVRQEDLHKSLRRVAEGGHHVQHLPLVLEGAVFALQHAQEHSRDEYLDLRFEVSLARNKKKKRCNKSKDEKNIDGMWYMASLEFV